MERNLTSPMGSGGDLCSRAVSSQVLSALKGLTSVFGMGTGGTPSPLPPENSLSIGLFRFHQNRPYSKPEVSPRRSPDPRRVLRFRNSSYSRPLPRILTTAQKVIICLPIFDLFLN